MGISGICQRGVVQAQVDPKPSIIALHVFWDLAYVCIQNAMSRMVSSSLEVGPDGALAVHADAHTSNAAHCCPPPVVLTYDWQVVVDVTVVVLVGF